MIDNRVFALCTPAPPGQPGPDLIIENLDYPMGPNRPGWSPILEFGSLVGTDSGVGSRPV